MLTSTPHISVCICTYKRQRMLDRLLGELGRQETNGQFTYSIVVADNDCLRSAKVVVDNFSSSSEIEIRYCVEPRQNIALARNKTIENAKGDFIALIDDDELPVKDWLLTLFKACKHYEADGVLGPVLPHFDELPPKWIVMGRFYERARYPTGLVIDWRKGRTGNLLLKRSVFENDSQPFREEFLTGEDQDFFRRMIESNHVFVWCNEAIAYEVVPSVRWSRKFMLKRALLRGKASLLHPSFGLRDILRSLVAVPAYMLILPFASLGGHHRFMTCLVKLFDHLGKLLALLGINAVHKPYVTE